MDFVTSLNELSVRPSSHSNSCSFVRIFSQLSNDEAQALQSALDNPNVTSSGIARVLSDRGFRMTHVTVARHRRRGQGNGCICP